MSGETHKRPRGEYMLIQVWNYVVNNYGNNNSRNFYDAYTMKGEVFKYEKELCSMCVTSWHEYITFPSKIFG